MNNKIIIRAFQHLSFETLKKGKIIPSISSEVCAGEQNQTILDGSLSLDVALDRMIEGKILADEAVRDKDREILLSQINSILEVVKAKRKKIAALPQFFESSLGVGKKKKP